MQYRSTCGWCGDVDRVPEHDLFGLRARLERRGRLVSLDEAGLLLAEVALRAHYAADHLAVV